MDFLINIKNDVTEQLPSKLIDYLLIDRPILDMDGNNLDQTKIDQFLDGNYSKRYIFKY